MTKREFEKIGKKLLPRLPGFSSKGQWLFMTPVGHTLRAISFDGSSDKHQIYLWVVIKLLSVPCEDLDFGLGWRIGGWTNSWNVNDPNLEESLLEAIKREALPFLEPIKTIEDTIAAIEALGKSEVSFVKEAMAFALARSGNVQKACQQLDEVAREALDMKGFAMRIVWREEMASRALTLKSLLLNNPVAAQNQLSKWEIESIKNLGLEKFV